MRLINTRTLQLEEFIEDETQLKYAILSHRWEEEELRFQDFAEGWREPRGKGYRKMVACCRQAAQDGYDYIWVDTCCIDKTSSAELGEAINSMYLWYQHAGICYVYLSDFSSSSSDQDVKGSFPESKWFTRGWTLQELIAPKQVVFFDYQWNKFGDKQLLAETIEDITKIDRSVLNGTADLREFSVAQKMSWAASRITTRIEDMAYCLLGIFEVNMPTLYGEREKAFRRLQEEIIKTNDDYTIFSWTGVGPGPSGLLALSPAAFKDCTAIRTIDDHQFWESMHVDLLEMRSGFVRQPFSMTNCGLSATLRLTPWDMYTYLVWLPCVTKEVTYVSIFLRKLEGKDQYIRVKRQEIDVLHYSLEWLGSLRFQYVPLFVEQLFLRGKIGRISDPSTLQYGFMVDGCEDCSELTGRPSITPIKDSNFRMFTLKPGQCGTVCLLDVSSLLTGINLVQLGFDWDFNPVCFLIASNIKPRIISSNDQPVEYCHSNGSTWTGSCLGNSAWSRLDKTTRRKSPYAHTVQRMDGVSWLYAVKATSNLLFEGNFTFGCHLVKRHAFSSGSHWEFLLQKYKE